ncbi:tetratricopeptide repeat protein [Nonomuraea sp. LPB2021202275-12-8]|uniref:tetratricopeptide repeat protein n=1 Tax=Nonomuraea sp. LPB2021202275-12-8 TaxID=3120159 RepID=UPI00300CDFAF
MDTASHRPGLDRVVEVYSGHDELVGTTGSGYVIGSDLVLTTGQVIDPEAPRRVRSPASSGWAEAEQVWRGRGTVNAALLRVTDPPWPDAPDLAHVRWARLAGDHLRCVAGGFPQARSRREPDEPSGVEPRARREVETVSGVVDAPVGAASGTLAVNVLGSEPDSISLPLWLGLSGAALLARPGGQILGVIDAARPGFAEGRLDVVPVGALLSDERFRELTGVRPRQVETVTGDDRVLLLPDLLMPAREEPPAGGADWSLLLPRHAVVPFLGRGGELADLRAWAAGPERLSVAAVTGQGGAGKTRLAVELCEELSTAGWDAGFLQLGSISGPLGDGHTRFDALRPTLLVADCPEPSAALLTELVRRLAGHRHNPRLRILLLARTHSEAEWWRHLGGRLQQLNRVAIRLDDHRLGLTERAEHAAAAMRAFSSRRAAPAIEAVSDTGPPTLDDPEYGQPLHVHVAALTRLRGDGAAAEPAGRFLAHEQEEWARTWPGGQVPGEEVTVRQAVAVLTLTAPDPAELRALLSAVPGLDEPDRRVAVADWLATAFPGRERPSPLGPDLLAERLLGETEELDTLVLAVHDHAGRTAAHLSRMLDILRRSSGQDQVRSALRSLVVNRLDRMLCEAATGPAEQLGDLLDAALRLLRDEPEPAGTVAALPPWQGGRLGSRALKVTLDEILVGHLRGGKGRADLATALTGLSARLAAVGRLDEAAAAAGEAVEIFAAAPPYEAAEGQAEALFAQAACLLLAAFSGDARLPLAASAGRPAQESAARFRILAEDDPRYAAHAERAHYNLACALIATGRPHEAVAAFVAAGGDAELARNVRDVLAVLPEPGTPVTWASLPSDARSSAGSGAVNVSTAGPAWVFGPLAPLDELEEEGLLALGAGLAVAATEAVGGVAGHDQEVCHHLHRLAVRLDRRGRGDEAVVPAAEAVARLRGLAREEPSLRSALAAAAGVLARPHADRGEVGDAVRSAAEAAGDLRALVVLEPGEHRHELVRQLLDLGEFLLIGGRAADALDPLEQSASLAAELGDGDERARARSRHLLGLCSLELGRPADSLAHLEAAAGLYQELGEHDEHVRRLCLEVLARVGRLRAAGPEASRTHARGAGTAALISLVPPVRPEEDVATAEQAPALRRGEAGKPAAEDPRGHVSALARLAWVLAAAGRAADGVVLATRAAELLQDHAADDPRHGPLAGEVAAAMGRSLVAVGRCEEAVAHLTASVDASEGHVDAVPAVRIDLVERLVLLAVALARTGRLEEAAGAADRVVELHGELRRPSPLALAGALRLQGGVRLARGDRKGALESAGQALALLPPEPTPYRRLLSGTCLQLSGLCRDGDGELAAVELVRGTTQLAGLRDEHGPLPPDADATHLLALLRLGRLQMERGETAGAATFYAKALEIAPAGPVGPLLDELSAYLAGASAALRDGSGRRPPAASRDEPGERPPAPSEGRLRGRARLAEAVAELLPPLADFTDALAREVPVSGGTGTYEPLGECLGAYAAVAGAAGDDESAAAGAELAVRVFQGLAAADPGRHRTRLGVALSTLGQIHHDLARPDLAVLERAADLLGEPAGKPTRAMLARTLSVYGDALLGADRPVEALIHLERAGDLCDELDAPDVAAMAYAGLASALAALDRPQAALEAVNWSLAEQERVPPELAAAMLPLRAKACHVRGMVLRVSGRKPEALAHLVQAVNLFGRPPRTAAQRLAQAEIAVVVVDDLLAEGRAEEAIGYAETAVAGFAESAHLKQTLAKQRLVRCHLMAGELGEANPLVEELIVVARRSGVLTYKAVLADSLAQSAELLTMLHLDDGPEAEARAREAIALYDELVAAGVDAAGVRTGRAGAHLSLAAALAAQGRAADEVGPLREAVAALELHAPGDPLLTGYLARAMLMLGDALVAAGRALEASAVLHRGTQVIEDGYLSAVAHAQLGLCQRELGRDDAAEAALRVSDRLLRDLLAEEDDDEELVEMLRDVLRSRLALLEKGGQADEVALLEHDLNNLRWFTPRER